MFGRKQNTVLVVKTDDLTGFVSAEPAFEAIREAHPGANISLLTTPALQRVARASPYFDQVAALPNINDVGSWREFVRQLKNAKFERVYDLAGNEAGRKLHGAMGPFRPRWFTAAPATRRKPTSTGLAGTPVFDRLYSDAGLAPKDRLPDFSWALEARKDSANMKPSWYGISGAFGLILPSAEVSQRWTAEGYAELCQQLVEAGFMPVLVGPKELHELGDSIADTAPQLVDLAGKTDHLQLAALAHEAAFFVSDNADEMHLAVSVGCQGVMMAIGTETKAEAPEGRHVVTLSSPEGAQAIESAFVWQTLKNMGLTGTKPLSAAAMAR